MGIVNILKTHHVPTSGFYVKTWQPKEKKVHSWSNYQKVLYLIASIIQELCYYYGLK